MEQSPLWEDNKVEPHTMPQSTVDVDVPQV
jgi:hypothetical protein